jgi:hypothetical protein
MNVKVKFEPGPAGTGLQECVFVGSDGTNDPQTSQPRMVVVAATHILNPAFVGAVEQIRASEASKEEKEKQLAAMPVQPEHIAEQLSKTCSTLEEFHDVCLELARRNAAQLEVQAQTGNVVGSKPTWSTEPQSTIKVGTEPKIAAEAQMTGGEVPTTGAGAIRKFFARLPGQSVGDPQRAVDIHSSALDPVVAAELNRLTAEVEQLKDEKDARVKDDELKGVMGILTELGALEDAKDREGFTKDLSALDEKALGVVEKLLKKVRDAKAGKPAGPKGPGMGMPPKPPAAAGPKAPPFGGKPPESIPKLSSQGNLGGMGDPSRGGLPLSASALGNMDPALVLQQIMLIEDQKKILGKTR